MKLKKNFITTLCDLHLSSLTRDLTWAHGSESSESQPLGTPPGNSLELKN